MSAPNAAIEDPLIAALPPNTDYITYLTILEYQLTPQNLPTLNRLLQEDDGTLASEIGWDLLKLVLPILRVEPGKAKECLDIISRRGNPREVIVRVSEELETLGVQESDGEADPTESTHNIPTFAGEAPHVHLGEMTLAGMPPAEPPRPQSQHSEHNFPDAAVEELKLQSLLSMLSSLHPRIKTQYPSRFLATSLPAALSAYRRLSMNNESTLAFLDTLTKLFGRTRPILPPRVPTADMLKMKSIPESAPVTSAPLPDPESKSETTAPSQTIAPNEQAINQRLIQAVLLEILEEYTAASSEAQPPLTARLRVGYEPYSLSLTRREELNALATTSRAAAADSLRNKFVHASKTLKLDVQTEMIQLSEPPTEDNETEEDHEYPTSPSQIPIASTGLLLLHCVQAYLQAEPVSFRSQVASTGADMKNDKVLQLLVSQYGTDTRLRQSGPALDYILSLLYTIFCIRSTPLITTSTDQSLLLPIFTILKDIFTSCPDPDLRDNAHHIATHLIHAYLSPPARLILIKDLLVSSTSSPITPTTLHPSQSGPLKALAVSWLKDEIYPTTTTLTMMESLPNASDRGLPKSTITGLTDVLFPTDSVPDPPITNITVTSTGTSMPQNDEEKIDTFADNLPFYISSLNLLCVFIKTHNQSTTEDAETDTSETQDTAMELNALIVKIASFLEKLEGWNVYLTGRLAANTGGDEVDGISVADVFALEDAVGRTREVVGERHGDVGDDEEDDEIRPEVKEVNAEEQDGGSAPTGAGPVAETEHEGRRVGIVAQTETQHTGGDTVQSRLVD